MSFVHPLRVMPGPACRDASLRGGAKARGHGTIPGRQRGQALVLALVLLFVCAIGLFFMFGTGQVSATRQRLDNAADAAAYSAALWRARVMNFHAYSNRAIVAQEVAIAQAVTLVSWARYFESLTGTAAALSAVYPPIGSVLAISADLARAAALVTEQTAVEEIAARGIYKQMLGTSQEILQRSVDTFGLGAVANEVARANDRRFFAFALPDEQNFTGITRRYTGDDRARLKSVVDDSLDDFVAGPRGLDRKLWLLPSLCFGNPLVDPSNWFQDLRKRGGTVMTPEFDRWEAGDTVAVHDWRPRSGLFGFGGCRSAANIHLGWGAAEVAVDEVQLEGRLQANPGAVRDNALATVFAETEMQARTTPGFAAYSGMAEVRELDYPALANPRFPVSTVAVLARVDGEDVRTANVLNVGTGRLRMAEHYAGNRVWSLAAAELYFRRPADDSGLIEFASLYSPYWQVRLVEPSAAQRAAAQAYVH